MLNASKASVVAAALNSWMVRCAGFAILRLRLIGKLRFLRVVANLLEVCVAPGRKLQM